MFAAREGAVSAVRSLADAGAKLDLVDPEGTSALIIAVINGRYDVVSALLEKGADPNVADIKGMTPLYAAVVTCTPFRRRSAGLILPLR